MSTRIRVRIDPNAEARLQQLANEHVEDKVLPKIVSAAKRIVPVDSGELKDSIHAKSEGDVHYIVAATEYAAHVEQGTSKMAAQPYLRPALTSYNGA